jgi:hypothetical protein
MGLAYQEAFREHLRRLAVAGELGAGIVAVGAWWSEGGQDQIDAVVLAKRGRTTTPVLAGESRWTRQVDAARLMRDLQRKSEGLDSTVQLRFAVCARETVINRHQDVLAITAADIFAPAT